MFVSLLIKKIRKKYHISRYLILDFFFVFIPTRILLNIIINIYRQKIAKKLFKTLFDNKNKRIIVFYDLKESSIAYGDFFYFCMFVRQLKVNGFRIKCYIITDTIRFDYFNIFNQKKIKKIIIELKLMFKFLCKQNLFQIKFMNIKKELDKNRKNFVFCEKKVISRQRIHTYYPLINKEIYNFYKNKSFLLKSNMQNIIAYGVRYQYFKSHSERNQNINQINNDIKFLKRKFNKSKIILITNYETQKKLIKLFTFNYKKVKFSQGKFFHLDLKILLRCKYFYTSTNSGLGTVNVFIDRPSRIICNNKDIYNKSLAPDFFYPTKIAARNFWPWLNKKIEVNFKSYYSDS